MAQVLVEPRLAVLEAEAARLPPSKRRLRPQRLVAVDPDVARVELRRDPVGARLVCRENGVAEAVGRVVSEPDRLLLGLEGADAQNGPEDLLAPNLGKPGIGRW